MKYDFGGIATKYDLLCGDGLTLKKGAFKHNNGKIVPLVWNHQHDTNEAVLGHALLEDKGDYVYAYCSFNDTDLAQIAKKQVEHGDVTCLSIFANKLKKIGNSVMHGEIREVSLVLAGANPGAIIDSYSISHSVSPNDFDAIICHDIEYDDEMNPVGEIYIPENGGNVRIMHSDMDESYDFEVDEEYDENVDYDYDDVDYDSDDYDYDYDYDEYEEDYYDDDDEGYDEGYDKDMSILDVYDSMSDVQQSIVDYFV